MYILLEPGTRIRPGDQYFSLATNDWATCVNVGDVVGEGDMPTRRRKLGCAKRSVLYRCPYDTHVSCDMSFPCLGCVEFVLPNRGVEKRKCPACGHVAFKTGEKYSCGECNWIGHIEPAFCNLCSRCKRLCKTTEDIAYCTIFSKR